MSFTNPTTQTLIIWLPNGEVLIRENARVEARANQGWRIHITVSELQSRYFVETRAPLFDFHLVMRDGMMMSGKMEAIMHETGQPFAAPGTWNVGLQVLESVSTRTHPGY